MQVALPKKAGKESPKETIHTFYGVDAEGNARVTRSYNLTSNSRNGRK
jgi:hypothetical protein